MGFTFSGAKVSGDLSTAFTQATVLYGETTTSATLGTVPVGKKWTIVTAYVSAADENSNIVYGRGQLKGGGTPLVAVAIENMTNEVTNSSLSITFPADCRPVLAAGDIVELSTPSGNHMVCGGVTYFEENA